MTVTTRPTFMPAASSFRDNPGVVELLVGIFRRDILAFYPQCRFGADSDVLAPANLKAGPTFHLADDDPDSDDIRIALFGNGYRLTARDGTRFNPHDHRMVQAIGAVLSLRYNHLFQMAPTSRLELYRGGSEDHYVAAFVEPSAYDSPASRPSRIASTIQTLRTTALSTYENRRVSTGALLLGPGDDPRHPARPTSPDALPYGVELTSLKSIHRLCDGNRTLYLVDREGKLAEIIDVTRWAGALIGSAEPEVPCARTFTAHAQATRVGGHVCLVLSPNQEIKLFVGGMQAFAFAHGRWRILDPQAKFATWRAAVVNPMLARVLFQTALDLAESRQGGLLVVVNDPCEAIGRLIAPHDVLSGEAPCGPPPELTPGDPLAKRALHYLARGRDVTDLDPSVVESLAGIDGALATDHSGRLLAFGAILRHDASSLPGATSAEGARTTAALVASRFGAVLKISEDGVVSCYLNGARVWDL
jgi:hypothetical protein